MRKVVYSMFVCYWQTADRNPASPAHELEFARLWQSVPKIVFSKTLTQVEGNAGLARAVVPEEIVALKQQPGQELVETRRFNSGVVLHRYQPLP